METEKDLYKMKLGDVFEPNSYLSINRVPGGWIYLFQSVNSLASTFVPFVPEENETGWYMVAPEKSKDYPSHIVTSTGTGEPVHN